MNPGMVLRLVGKWKHKTDDGSMEVQLVKGWTTVALLLEAEHKMGEPFDLDTAMKRAGWKRA